MRSNVIITVRLLQALLLCSLLWVLSPQEASAQAQSQKTYMVDFVDYEGQVGVEKTNKISHNIRDRLKSQSRVTLSAPMKSGGGSNPAINQAMRGYETGKALYVAQNFKASAKELQNVLEHFEKNAADINDWSLIEALLFRLSAAHFQSGDQKLFEAGVRRLISFNPDFEIPKTEEEFPEGFEEQFKTLRDKHLKQRTGKLDTKGINPTGAEIWLDGKIRGVSPVGVSGVIPGRHFVVLRKGEQASSLMIEVKPKKKFSITATLSTGGVRKGPAQLLSEELADGQIDRPAREAFKALADRTAAPLIVTGIIVPVGNKLFVVPLIYNDADGSIRRLEAMELEGNLLSLKVKGYKITRKISASLFSSKTGTLLEGFESIGPDNFKSASASIVTLPTDGAGSGKSAGGSSGDKSLVTGPSLLETGSDKGESDDWYTNPWVWTGVGAGVLAVALTSILLSVDEDVQPTPGFNATITW